MSLGKKTALLVIDVQAGIFDGQTPAKDYAERIGAMQRLIAQARAAARPVIFVQHDDKPHRPLAPGKPGWAIDARLGARADELVVHKTECDSFYGTPLKAALAERGISDLVICGCWSNFCVDSTSRSALNHGFDVQLAADAHACGDTGELSAAQIIAYHNCILDGHSAGPALLRVVDSAAVSFY